MLVGSGKDCGRKDDWNFMAVDRDESPRLIWQRLEQAKPDQAIAGINAMMYITNTPELESKINYTGKYKYLDWKGFACEILPRNLNLDPLLSNR